MWYRYLYININGSYIYYVNLMYCDNKTFKNSKNKKTKTNWLGEYTKIKKYIPESWQQKWRNEESSSTKYNVNKRDIPIYIQNGNIAIKDVKNKQIYEKRLSKRCEQMYVLNKWQTGFHLENKVVYTDVLSFAFSNIINYEIQIFKWKVLHSILPNRIFLLRWKIANYNVSKICLVEENYNHYFIECTFNDELWNFIEQQLIMTNMIIANT